jgi:hypothetical protein
VRSVQIHPERECSPVSFEHTQFDALDVPKIVPLTLQIVSNSPC